MPQRRVGGVLAALCVAAGASGLLAIGLLAPPNHRHGAPDGSTKSGWPIADAFSSPGAVSWLADDPNTSAIAGTGIVPGHGSGSTPPPPQPPPAPALAAPAPPESFVSHTSGLPAAGEATEYGCGAALQYLDAYAAPGFWMVCPGNARGHQALTACQSGSSPCSMMRMIVIADPCPSAYMNEASNSWALMGESTAPLDPYGSCA